MVDAPAILGTESVSAENSRSFANDDELVGLDVRDLLRAAVGPSDRQVRGRRDAQSEVQALLAGSPAIDAGAPAGCQGHRDGEGILDALVTDQRGRLRVDGDGSGGVRCDVGAYEFAATTTDLIFADGF